MVLLQLTAGILILIIGAELVVRGAVRLAVMARISPLVIGLTVVAFGTSAPELAVSIGAAVSNQPGISLGNVIGSNIFNVLFILGISAMIVPLVVSAQLIRFDVPVMIATSVVALVLGLDGNYDYIDGAVLVAALVAYTLVLILMFRGRDTTPPGHEEPAISEQSEPEISEPGLWTQIALVGLGLGMLVIGSRVLVTGAVSIARIVGVSEVIIGLTIVAAGTSLPEVITSIVATLRGERDMAVGNVVGSNIFNILGVLGMTALLSPQALPVSGSILTFDLPIMIAVALACLPVFFTGGMISRSEGAIFFVYYVIYTVYLVLAAAEHDALNILGKTVLYFVIPITLLTLGVLTAAAIRRQRDGGPA